MKNRLCYLAPLALLTNFAAGFYNFSSAQNCQLGTSDSDGDGWGWENNASCKVVEHSTGAPVDSVTPSICVDTDGDGWGWTGTHSCRVTANAITDTDSATNTINEDCPDSDGDGWGWANGQSCRTADHVQPPLESDSTDPVSIPQTLPQTPLAPTSRPYQQRDPFLIKSINTDSWPDRNELLRGNIEGIAVNLVWSNWESSQRNGQCLSSQQQYDGYCYQIATATDQQIRYWSGQGKNVTGVIWGVPAWARRSDCQPADPSRAIFCSSSDTAAFARFTGMLAQRYNNRSGNGQINDFVLHNEVNMNEWYNYSCGNGSACDANRWMDNYIENFNAAYDQIIQKSPNARVFAPFAHQFAEVFDQPASSNPLISVKTFVRRLNTKAGDRIWKIAYHPYNKSLFQTGFSVDDLPHVTLGNIGVIAGWLRTEFPDRPQSWEIYLTESGYNSLPPQGSESGQALDVCNSLYNVLATPGIENYVYHRLQDHPTEVSAGIALGLRDQNGRAKPSWDVWINASGRNGARDTLDCGFQNLPYTRVGNYSHVSRLSRVSSRLVNSGYSQGNAWYLHRNHQPQAVMLYECQQGNGSYVTKDMFCNGNLPLGPVGYTNVSRGNSQTDLDPLFSCENSRGRFISNDETCGSGGQPVEFLGYAKPSR